MEQIKRILFLLFVLIFASPVRADVTDLRLSTAQIFDVQWNISGGKLNASGFNYIYASVNYETQTTSAARWTAAQTADASSNGRYISFFNSTTHPGTYGMAVFEADGSVYKVINNTGTFRALADGAIFYNGNGMWGTLITTGAGYSYGSSGSWSVTADYPTTAQLQAYTPETTQPLAAGETAPPPAPACDPCSPQGDNLGFESGTTANWTISNGTGTAKTAPWSPNGEGVQTSNGMTNYSPGGGKTWSVVPYGNHMMVLQAGGGSPTFDSAAGSLGLTAEQIQAIKTFLTEQGGNSNPTNAAWAKRTVTLEAGKTYVIAWQYLSTDYVPFNDGSMITLVGPSVPTLNNENKNYALLGFTNPGTGNYSTDSYGATGWQLATIEVSVSGDYTLGFASFNLGDTALSPILFVDDLQGTTTLNGTAFEPVPPNPGSSAPSTGGSTAPTLCCGGSSTPFNANTNFDNRASVWSQQNGNKVIIEQIGNYNSTTITQVGNHNYSETRVNGSNNATTVNQTSVGATANYIESFVIGNSNTQSLTQNSTGGTKGIYLNGAGDNNNVTVTQNDSGNHYAEITLSNGNKTVNISQDGSAGHMAKIELSGGETSISTTQTGATQQFYSITHNCANATCSAITVTQGQ